MSDELHGEAAVNVLVERRRLRIPAQPRNVGLFGLGNYPDVRTWVCANKGKGLVLRQSKLSIVADIKDNVIELAPDWLLGRIIAG